jgi:hypothetical protein
MLSPILKKAARELLEIVNSGATIQAWRCHKMSFARQNCRPLRPHIRTIDFASFHLFCTFFPYFDPTDRFSVSGSVCTLIFGSLR